MFHFLNRFAAPKPVARSRRRNKLGRASGFESLESREMMTGTSALTMYPAATISSYTNVGFQNNPVASLSATVAGKQDATPAHFTAQVNWGDENGWQPAQVVVNNTAGTRIPLLIEGSHTYDEPGTHTIQVKVTGDGITISGVESVGSVENMPSQASQPGLEAANLGGPKPLGATQLVLYDAQTLTTTQGAAAKGIVATADGYYGGLHDTVASDYKTQINWGDSPRWTTGNVVAAPAGSSIPFQITGTHTYQDAGAFPVTVVLTGPDGQTLTERTSMVVVNPTSATTAPLLLKGSVAVNATETQLVAEGAQLDAWGANLQAATNDAVKSFAEGLLNPSAQPSAISVSNPAQYPFSRSFFDAGRMLQGIANGVASLPKDVLTMFENMVSHPETMIPGYPVFAAANTLGAAVANPTAAMNQIMQGFQAFANLDPAQVGGQSIPSAVLFGILGSNTTLAGQIDKAETTFTATGGAAPIKNYGGMSSNLIPPSQVIPSGEKPLAAVINQIRWANPIANVNPGFGTVVGTDTNCAYAAIVTDRILAGATPEAISQGLMLRTAPPGVPQSVGWVEQFFQGSEFGDEIQSATMVQQMNAAGNGARGIVYGFNTEMVNGVEEYGTGHFFNVVNNNGVITFYDGQSGGVANLSGYSGFSLLRTN